MSPKSIFSKFSVTTCGLPILLQKFITSGLYDSGFNNIVGGTIHVRAGPAKIVNHTRIAQFIYAEAETVGMYDGDYNAPSSVN